MIKKIALSLLVTSVLMAQNSTTNSNENKNLEQQIKQLQKELASFKKEQSETNEALLEEVSNSSSSGSILESEYKSFSSMGEAASKVYHTDNFVSIGGYGEYKFKKYSAFKNYSSATANETQNKAEFNIVRFVPYIGFKFNDWIVMNTEIEFEDGGSRSDNTKNYKYAIVEFSYLDFLIDEKFAVRVGHILVPFGMTNLNHEPVAYLTTERPRVETFIIPSTWHTNGLLTHGKVDSFEYYAGIITSPDAGAFTEGRYIQQGRLGARQFTDDMSMVLRGSYDMGSGINVGSSFLYGKSSVLEESRPGIGLTTANSSKVDITMLEVHGSYKNSGFDVKALASYGGLSGDVSTLPNPNISESVNGQYLTVGYDVLNSMSTTHQVFVVGDIERLDMDATNKTTNPDNNKFLEYSTGLAYFPDPKVVLKADYTIKDYASGANFADEQSFTMQAGFIF